MDEVIKTDRNRVDTPAVPRKTERVYEWVCNSDKPNCTRKEKPVHTKPERLPYPCRSCGDDNWRKVDDKVREVK